MTCQTCGGPIDFRREYTVGPFTVGRNGFAHLNGALGHDPFPAPVRLVDTARNPGAFVTVTAVGEVALEVAVPTGEVAAYEFDEPTDRDEVFANTVDEYLDHGFEVAA
jgi:hypothetical protein